MLKLQDVSLFAGRGENITALIADLSLTVPRGHFAAIIGPSGCGKSTLLKIIAGIAEGEEEGTIFWDGRNLHEKDLLPSEIGYVPQFSIAHEDLTVFECVDCARRLRVAGLRGEQGRAHTTAILESVGLAELHDRLVRVLSGGQRRRLALAMELVSTPSMLLCDEVTSGLDPNSEEEIVALLRALSRESDRLVLSVTHSLRQLDVYDSVVVLYQGVLAYHGPAADLTHYFQITKPEDIYIQLGNRSPQDWHRSWLKYRDAYRVVEEETHSASSHETHDSSVHEAGIFAPPAIEEDSTFSEEVSSSESDSSEVIDITATEQASKESTPAVPPLPDAFSQFVTLFRRRMKIFFRNHAQLLLQAGLIFGFPIIVAVFAWNGLPQVRNLSMGIDPDVVRQLVEARDFLIQATKIGSLVSGIVMFQVILLTLMGANNSGREIAAERLVFEKEKLSGVRPGSYVASKAAFLCVLVLVQSLWMGLFVHFVCGLPGDLLPQLGFLVLVNAAMSAICLGISSLMRTAEQASLVSIYLVGFQLPLSGAVLALPEWLAEISRPFIAAYWSWSGVLQTLKGERYYDILQMVVQTQLSPVQVCVWMLVIQIIAGLLAAYIGCSRARWQ